MYDKEKEAEVLARSITDYLNTFNDDEMGALLVEKLLNSHRTLQQNFMRFVVKWIKANANTSFFDLRNEGTIMLCKDFNKLMEEEINGYLPTV